MKDIFDPAIGNNGKTCDLLDNPYVKPHPHQGDGDRIDYILFDSPRGLKILREKSATSYSHFFSFI